MNFPWIPQVFLVTRFSSDDERKRLVHATARLVGGSMTLNLDIVSFMSHVAESRLFSRNCDQCRRTEKKEEEDRRVSGRGAFFARKLSESSWSTCTGNPSSFLLLGRLRNKAAKFDAIEERVSQSANCFSLIERDCTELFLFCAIVGIAYLSPR